MAGSLRRIPRFRFSWRALLLLLSPGLVEWDGSGSSNALVRVEQAWARYHCSQCQTDWAAGTMYRCFANAAEDSHSVASEPRVRSPQPRRNFSNCPSALRIASQTVPRDLKKWSRNRSAGPGPLASPSTGQTLRKGSTSVAPSDQTSAAGEAPLVANSGGSWTPRSPAPVPICSGSPVGRNFQLITDAHDIRGFQVTMREAFL